MNIEQAKQLSLTNILSSVGCKPSRQRGKRLFYLSPFRNEKIPSFLVNTDTNTWYDFGMSAGGDIIDFVRHYAHIENVSNALHWLSYHSSGVPSVKQPAPESKPKVELEKQQVYTIQTLAYRPLLDYLARRGITSDVAIKYCKEIWYPYNGKTYFGVAFPTRSESYEVRNCYHKRCVGHKDISFISISQDRSTSDCCVFEGFIDFLSYVMFYRQKHPIAQHFLCDCIILNSVACLKKVLPELERYATIHCYLDNDESGRLAMEHIRTLYPQAFSDESSRFAPINDLNDYLIHVLGLVKE